MKKTISVTLGARIFVLEEDAYALLDTYLHDLRRHFQNERIVTELMLDIENSLADKFTDLLHDQKQAVTREDVESVIRVLGRPEEIAETNDTAEEPIPPQTDDSAAKRLYRDADDLVLAGVSSGLAAYFGADPLYVRLAFILLTFANGLGLLVYAVLWLVIPKAETNAQKLQMRGRPNTIAEIQELSNEKAQGIRAQGRTTWNRLRHPDSALYRLITSPVRLISVILVALKRFWNWIKPAVRAIVGLSFILGSVLGIMLVSAAAFVAALRVNSPYLVSDLPLKELATQPLYYVGAASAALFLIIPLVFGIVIGVSCLRAKSQFRVLFTSILTVIWFAAGTCLAVAATDLIPFASQSFEAQQARTTVSRNYDLAGFDRVAFNDHGDIKIVRGNVFAVSFTSDEQTLNRLAFKNENGQLTVSVGDGVETPCFFCHRRKLEGTLTLPVLTAYVGKDGTGANIQGFTNDIVFTLSDAADATMALAEGMRVTSTLSDASRLTLSGPARSLYVTLSDASRLSLEDTVIDTIETDQKDASRVYVDGMAQTLRTSLKDVARLEANSLEAKNVFVTAADASRAEVYPLESFAATSTDIGRIEYKRAITGMRIVEENERNVEERDNQPQ